MTNELAALLLLLLWLWKRGPLCLLILLYYVAYMAMESYPQGEIVRASGWVLYYVRQSALDTLAILGCCYLSTIYQDSKRLALCYAVIIGTSQALHFAMLADPHLFAELHDLRQEIAIPLDLSAAVLGSGLGVYLLRFANRLRAAYNQLHPDSNNRGKTK